MGALGPLAGGGGNCVGEIIDADVVFARWSPDVVDLCGADCSANNAHLRQSGRSFARHAVYNIIGLGAQRNRDFERAVRVDQKALTYDRGRTDIVFNLGVSYGEMGQFEKAIASLHLARESDPQNAETHALLGLALFESGAVQAAVEAYGAALARDENHLAAGVNLGWALYFTGRFAEGIAVYGAEQGEAIGAVADLEAFAERGIRPQEVRERLNTYWPK